MIKNISAEGKYLIVINGSSETTYINNYSNGHGVGNMQYNTFTQNIEIYDGTKWIPMNPNCVTVGLTPDAIAIIDWARKKRNEEIERDLLAVAHPTIKHLINQIEEIEEQIQMIQLLLRSSENEGV